VAVHSKYSIEATNRVRLQPYPCCFTDRAGEDFRMDAALRSVLWNRYLDHFNFVPKEHYFAFFARRRLYSAQHAEVELAGDKGIG
jgi:hypothetical protein